jgi:hypothetical protein
VTYPYCKILAFSPLFWAVLATVLPPQIAWADSASDADAAISKGIEMRRQGKNEEALELFQNAYRLAPSPRAKTQIALAEQAIGRWADAERDLADAMSQASDPWIARQRTVLTEAMGVIRRHLGALTVKGEPAGAIVELDGDPVGTIPLPERHVTAGEVVVTVRAQGFVSVTRKVTVTPGELAAEVFRLKHIESDSAGGGLAMPRASTETPASSGPAVQLNAQAPNDQPAPPPGADGRLRLAGWITGAAAGLSLAAGTTFLLLSQSKFHSFDNDCGQDDVTGAVVSGNTKVSSSECQNRFDAWHTDRTVGVIGLIAGGALAAASTVLFFKAQNSSASAYTHAMAACAPTGATGLLCSIRF